MTAEKNRRYRRLLVLAGAALLWELLWQRLWPLACIVGLFVALALLDVLPRLPGWVHFGALVLFAVTALAALAFAVRGVRLPERRACRRRLEQDTGLPHRPLSAAEDRLVAGGDDPLARSLWALHQERMAAAADRLVVKPPSPGVARVEPWGVRAGVLLLLAIGMAAAGGLPGERLERAVRPALASPPRQHIRVEIWITPPAYTGVAPILLAHGGDGPAPPAPQAADGEADPVPVPAGSTLIAQVSGTRTAPRLVIGKGERGFTALSGESGHTRTRAYRAEATITGGDGLGIRVGARRLVAWPIRVVADAPPTASFAKAPGAAGNGTLRLAYTAADDYGVQALLAEIGRDTEAAPAAVPEGEDIRLDLPLPRSAGGTATTNEDLSEHALAGAPVRIRLVARDAAGQSGGSEEVRVVLPERTFRHPVARAIIGERKRLDPAAAPPLRAEVARGLDAIGRRPEAFDHDVVVSLALAIARGRLVNDDGADAIASVRSLLWASALALDEGNVPRAEQAVAEAREKLQEALRGDADAAEIERLTDALEQALTQYVNALAEELARRGGMEAPFPADATFGSDELRDMMEMVRELARLGARDGARQVLDQVQSMLEGLRGGLDSGVDPAVMAEASALMQVLRDLTARQQRLLDETFARLREQTSTPMALRQGHKGPRDDGADGAGAADQEDLRRQLAEFTDRLQDFIDAAVPGGLGEAEDAMGAAARALARGNLPPASDAQAQALDALRNAQQGSGQAMGRRLGGGLALFPGGSRPGGDLFGRTPGGRALGVGDVDIPGQGELRRAGEILEELRRRAGDRSRPEAELDYIDRLLRRF